MDKIYKKLLNSNSKSEETQKILQAVETRHGIIHGSYKVHKIYAAYFSH